MQKIKKFSNIPQFTRDGNWECDFDIDGLKSFIEEETKEGLQLNPPF